MPKGDNPRSQENLQPNQAPDKPGDGRSVGVWLRNDQLEALDRLEGFSYQKSCRYLLTTALAMTIASIPSRCRRKFDRIGDGCDCISLRLPLPPAPALPVL
jgi:hypothetical protein